MQEAPYVPLEKQNVGKPTVVETLARFDADRSRAKALLESAGRLAPLADAILQSDIEFGAG